METTRRSCRYCLSPLEGVVCRHCDSPHDPTDCTLCWMATAELERMLKVMRRR